MELKSKRNEVLITGREHKETRDIKFSHYPAGYVNKYGTAVLSARPEGVWTLREAYDYIKGPVAKRATERLRELIAKRVNPEEPTKEEKDREQEYKKLNFAIVTAGGVFSYRNASSMAMASYVCTLDVDELSSAEEVKSVQKRLVDDERLRVLLSFVSPRGRGVKFFVEIPERLRGLNYRDAFERIARYVGFEHGIKVDGSGSDVSRACYLPYDDDCYIDYSYLSTNNFTKEHVFNE